MEARERMHNAATCAGLGFGNALASMAHAMGHALGAMFHVPHGRAVGVCLPYTVEFAAREAPGRFAEMAALLGCTRAEGEAAARSRAARIRDLCREIGSPTCVAEAGVERVALEAHLDKLVDDAFNDTQMVATARSPSYDELRRIFMYAHEGKPIDF
jgi:alcohol dehydrogenase class IV